MSDTINGTSTIISPLFNGGKFNGDEADIEGLITETLLKQYLSMVLNNNFSIV